MKKFVFMVVLLTALTGCFSVLRIPFPIEQNKCAACGSVTNTVYRSCPNYPMCIFPSSAHMRYHLFAFSCDDTIHVGGRVAGPFAGIVSLIGLPGDLLVDVIALPWDWDASETASCPLCNHRGSWNNPVSEDAPVDGVIIRCNGTRVR